MPGHVKKTTGPDPDPSPWLVVSPELKNKLKAKPYDTKKSVWVSIFCCSDTSRKRVFIIRLSSFRFLTRLTGVSWKDSSSLRMEPKCLSMLAGR